jgi:FHA domain
MDMNCSVCGRQYRAGSVFCDTCDSWVISAEPPRAEQAYRAEQPYRAEEPYPAEQPYSGSHAERGAPMYTRTFVGHQYNEAPETTTTYWPPPQTEEREFIPAAQYQQEQQYQQPQYQPDQRSRPDQPDQQNQYAMSDDEYFDFEATTMSNRRRSSRFWTLDMPDQTVEVLVGTTIVGRAATPREEFPSARLLTMSSVSRSVSKSHAVFMEESGSLVIRDLQSTNGVIVTLADGSEIDLGVGGKLEIDESCTIELGDLVVKVHKH